MSKNFPEYVYCQTTHYCKNLAEVVMVLMDYNSKNPLDFRVRVEWDSTGPHYVVGASWSQERQ